MNTNVPSIPSMGVADKNLSRRFANLSEDKKATINLSYPDGINAGTIGKLDSETRNTLKTAIDTAEKKNADAKQIKKEEDRTVAIQSVKDKGMGDDELVGENRLIFIGTGSGGSSDRNQYNKNLIDMKNSTYYAATKERDTIKEITSKTNSVGPVGGKVDQLITLTKQAIIKTSDAKEEFRNRLTNTLSNELSALLPDGVKNLKFANKLKQSLQIVLGYNKAENGSINGKGRMQFVPKVGDPVSTSITIKDSKYSFDDKALLSNKEAGKNFEEVASKLGLKLESNEDEIKRTENELNEAKIALLTMTDDEKAPQQAKIDALTASLKVLQEQEQEQEAVTGGKKRKTYRRKNASNAKRSKVAKKTRKAHRKMKRSKR